jgi:hypothetical protein
MGNARLGSLPRSRDWGEVVGLIEHGAEAAQVAAAVLFAARRDLAGASKDPGVLAATALVAGLPFAAREASLAEAAHALGLVCPDDPDRHRLTAAVSDAVDQALPNNAGRTDLGEMAQAAAAEALPRALADRASLFDPDGTAGCRGDLADLAAPGPFGGLLSGYFARLLFKVLDYYLSRELTLHVGSGHRFASLADVAAFYDALEAHCAESSGVLRDFAHEHVSKYRFEEGALTPARLRDFVHGAAAKLAGELQRRAGRGDE